MVGMAYRSGNGTILRSVAHNVLPCCASAQESLQESRRDLRGDGQTLPVQVATKSNEPRRIPQTGRRRRQRRSATNHTSSIRTTTRNSTSTSLLLYQVKETQNGDMRLWT